MNNKILKILTYILILGLLASYAGGLKLTDIPAWVDVAAFIIGGICLYLSIKRSPIPFKNKLFLAALFILALISYLFNFYLITFICTLGLLVWFWSKSTIFRKKDEL